MQGLILQVFSFVRESTDELLQSLIDSHQHSDGSQITAWRTLIEDVKAVLRTRPLPDSVCISLEYELPTDGMGIDLLVTGYGNDGHKHAFIIEAKQWNTEYIRNCNFSSHRTPGCELHPQIQVSRHKLSFVDYLDIGHQFIVKPYVFIRNCSKEALEILRSKNLDPGNSSSIPMDNSLETFFEEIRTTLIGGDTAMTDELNDAEYVPSKSIIDAMQSIVTREPPFILTPEQEEIVNRVREQLADGKRVIRITGAAGSGKTAILLNLYVDFLNGMNNGGLRPIFVSGAQNTAYYQSLYSNVRSSFTYSFSLERMLGSRSAHRKVVLMDEAQHNQTGIITDVVNSGAVLILCYDPGQIINADNALNELQELEHRDDFVSLHLNNSVRFNGSLVAEENIQRLLNGEGTFQPDDRFELRVFRDLRDFQNAVLGLMREHRNDTVAVVGLLSADANEYTSPENPESILFTDWSTQNPWEKAECRWMPYVTGKNYLQQHNGKIWVGTWWMPGLDVDDICVIIGGDAKLTTEGLMAVPDKAKHFRMMTSVAIEQNLPDTVFSRQTRNGEVSIRYAQTARNILAFLNRPGNQEIKDTFIRRFSELLRNNYYIMMSRGRKRCYVFFTNNDDNAQ